jgi:hypothetical protein
MEIKLSAGDKIQVPTGCKATIEDDFIVIEEQKEEFKEGDILIARDTGLIVILKNYQNEDKTVFCSYYNSEDRPHLNWIACYFSHATEEEKQKFFDELKAKGLRWNAEAKTMERIRKRAKKGREYLIVNRLGDVVKLVDEHSTFDDMNYNLGNYFLPEEIEEAELAAKFIRAIYEKRLKV